jgi:AcrR family transcriptional regulator
MRERLLDAAEHVLQTKRDGTLSLQEVAQAAGVTTGAVQHHFPTKIVLRTHVVQHMLRRLGETTDFWPEPEWPLERRAQHFVQNSWSKVFGHPRFCGSWAAYLSVNPKDQIWELLARQRDAAVATMHEKLFLVFPELAARADGTTCTGFVLSTLRGMGLAVPLEKENSFDDQLRLLETFIVQMCQESHC